MSCFPAELLCSCSWLSVLVVGRCCLRAFVFFCGCVSALVVGSGWRVDGAGGSCSVVSGSLSAWFWWVCVDGVRFCRC